MWTMEGSVDGVNWDVLTNMSWTTAVVGTKWYSDMETSCYGTYSDQTGKSFPIRGTPETPATFNVLGNCESVSVASGATLEKQGNGDVVIRNLTIDANGFGTINGFDFADIGSISISGAGNVSDRREIPGTFVNCSNLANIRSGWKLSVDGRLNCVIRGVSSSGLVIAPRGICVSFK